MSASYCNRNDMSLRIALWEEYDHKDYYTGTPILFRELEIDHIIPKVYFKSENTDKLNALIKKYHLSVPFERDDLLNYVPTRREINSRKGADVDDSLTLTALRTAEKRKPSIIRRIENYRAGVEVIATAAKLSSSMKTEKDLFDVIDILLGDMEDFPEEERQVESICFIKSTNQIVLHGALPTIQNLTPGCRLEFRTLFLRGISLGVDGKSVIELLCQGNHTPLNANLRKYIIKASDKECDIRISNNDFHLRVQEAEELCLLIDSYCNAYIAELKRIEKQYDLLDFPISPNGRVRLLCMRKSVCQCLCNFFLSNPDFDNMKLTYHGNMLRADSARGRLHFMIMITQAENHIWHSEQEFYLELVPYYSSHDTLIVYEELWAPTDVKKWLYQVLECSISKELNAVYKGRREVGAKAAEVKAMLSEIFDNGKMKSKRICMEDITNQQELLKVIRLLQAYFSLSSTAPFYCQENSIRVYDALLLLLNMATLPDGSYQYICGNLPYSAAASKAQLIIDTERYIRNIEDKKIFSRSEIDCVMRCLSECIERNTYTLTFQIIKEVMVDLEDFIDRYNSDMLIQKYIAQ